MLTFKEYYSQDEAMTMATRMKMKAAFKKNKAKIKLGKKKACLLYTSPSPRDLSTSRMPSSA